MRFRNRFNSSTLYGLGCSSVDFPGSAFGSAPEATPGWGGGSLVAQGGGLGTQLQGI